MEFLLVGLQTALTPNNLLFCLLGVTLGTFIGVIPGIGAIAAVSMLLPITFHLDATTSIILLAGVYYGAEYGGSTASILLNLPGTASNAVTCLDGYPMAQQGRAGVALFMSTLASFFGGTMGIIAIVWLSPLIVKIALLFGPAEYFAVMVFGLIAATPVAGGAPLKNVTMVLMGLLLGTIGMDLNSGILRFTGGSTNLMEGFSIIALAMGLFGVSEVIFAMRAPEKDKSVSKVGLKSMIPSSDDLKRSVAPMARGAAVGGFFGVLPGTGPTIAAFMSYALERRFSKNRSLLGTGAIEGVTAPEAANNAAAQTAFIPTLTLGIPGSATMAIMLGALMIHGITPGPTLIIEHPEVFWGLIGSFWIGNILLIILNIPLIGIWVRILTIPNYYLLPGVIVIICVGIYGTNTNIFDVWAVLFFGLFGYVLRRLDYSPAPLLVGFILGPMMEENLRRALLLSDGQYTPIFMRPLSGFLLIISIVILLGILIGAFFKKNR